MIIFQCEVCGKILSNCGNLNCHHHKKHQAKDKRRRRENFEQPDELSCLDQKTLQELYDLLEKFFNDVSSVEVFVLMNELN